MEAKLVILGLVSDIIGVIVLSLVAILNPRSQRIHMHGWWRRYEWWEHSPLYKNTETKKWMINFRRTVPIYWIISRSQQWNIIGVLLVLIGFLLQIWFYLS